MAEVQLIKMPGGLLRPANDEDAEYLHGVPNGRLLIGEFRMPRNPAFLRKFHAMINLGFQYFDPPLDPVKGITPSKDRERFREDVTILAGFRDAVVNIKGEVRWKARSISFANMEEDEFQRVYKAVFSVIWQQVLQYVRGLTEAEAENIINSMVSFDG